MTTSAHDPGARELLTSRPALRAAADVWERQGAELRLARVTLDDADPALLGRRVAPAAEAFLERWVARVHALGTEAEGHAAALVAVWPGVEVPDLETALALRGPVPPGLPGGR